MIVSVGQNGIVELVEANDFRRFSVEIHAPRVDRDTATRWISPFILLDSDAISWVEIEALKKLLNLASQSVGTDFEAMIARALTHGWISEDRKYIKSHVVWKSQGTDGLLTTCQ